MYLRKSLLSFVVINLITFLYLFMFLSNSENPDYEAYEKIFNNASIEASWEPGYNFINYYFRLLWPDYDAFRLSAGLLYSLTFSLLFLHARRISGVVPDLSLALMFGLMVGLLSFEYVAIRMRTGVMISFVNMAVVFYSYRYLVVKIFALILIALAFSVHLYSAAVLAFYFMVVIIHRFVWSKVGFFSSCFLSSILYSCFYYIIGQFALESRSDWLSELNPYRFIYMGALPLVISIAFSFAFPLVKSVIHRDSFIMVFIAACTALSVVYLSGFASLAGEALVRVHSFLAYPLLLAALVCQRLDHKLIITSFVSLTFIVLMRSLHVW